LRTFLIADCGTIAVLGAALLKKAGVDAALRTEPGHVWVVYGENHQFSLFSAPPMDMNPQSLLACGVEGYQWIALNIPLIKQFGFLVVLVLATIPKFTIRPWAMIALIFIISGWAMAIWVANIKISYANLSGFFNCLFILGFSIFVSGLALWVVPWLAVHRGELRQLYLSQTVRIRNLW
jgi:hypothetical protein